MLKLSNKVEFKILYSSENKFSLFIDGTMTKKVLVVRSLNGEDVWGTSTSSFPRQNVKISV